MKLHYYGRMENGTMIINRDRMMKEVRQAFDGKKFKLTIEENKQRRSTPQNRYLWGVVYEQCRAAFYDAGHIGITKDEVHEFFKDRFLNNGAEIISPETGEIVKMRNSTATLPIGEMLDYVTQIEIFMMEFFNMTLARPEGIEAECLNGCEYG